MNCRSERKPFHQRHNLAMIAMDYHGFEAYLENSGVRFQCRTLDKRLSDTSQVTVAQPPRRAACPIAQK